VVKLVPIILTLVLRLLVLSAISLQAQEEEGDEVKIIAHTTAKLAEKTQKVTKLKIEKQSEVLFII
jgi:hypothetical protein